MAKYKTYSIANDTLNGSLNMEALHKQMLDNATLSNVFDGINKSQGSDNFDVYLFQERNATYDTAMDAVVSAHDGTALPVEPETVQLSNLTPNTGIPKVATYEPEGTFNSYITHDWCDNSTWPSANDSEYILEPSAGKLLRLKKAEVQFSHDIGLSGVTELYFDIMAYDPNNLPNRQIVERVTYKSIKDVLNVGNAHFSTPVALDGMTNAMTTVQFNYPRSIDLYASSGMQIRLSTQNHTAMNGEFCTVSFVCSEEDE